MNRPDKRNAMSDAFIAELDAAFTDPPDAVKVFVLTGAGGHFCAGLDLAEHVERSAEDGIYHSRGWHRILDRIQFGGRPVVSAMEGAVIGGGLEIATATHVRIAEPSTIFQLPEGRRGIFVGGGATCARGAHPGGRPDDRDDVDRAQIQRRGRAGPGSDPLCRRRGRGADRWRVRSHAEDRPTMRLCRTT